jgi:hypothetical protein
MLEHMTLATAATGLIGLGIGTVIGGFFAGVKHNGLRATIAKRDADLDSLRDTLEVRDVAVDVLTNIVDRLKRDLGRKNAEIVEMAPHAEVGRKHLAQRQIALAAANAANARRAAEKAGNVRPIKARG